jgi:hypothetical protein
VYIYFCAEASFIAGVKIMQTSSSGGSFKAVQASIAATANLASRTPAMPYPYQPSQPHVLTDALKAQLAAANQQRRENLYPRLVQTLATIEQSTPTHNQSQGRAMSLEELAEANRARRSRLRESGYALPQSGMV